MSAATPEPAVTTWVAGALDAPDRIRPPSALDLRASAYKEWLHVNAFDLAAGRMLLVNVSLHGDPEDRRSLAAATVASTALDGAFRPRVEVVALGAATVTRERLAVPGVAAVTLDAGTGGVRVSAVQPGGDVLEIACTPSARPILADHRTPFGSGWIAWRAVPRLSVAGPHTSDDGGLTVYHDHNWGRWHWGDDAAWEWGVLLADDGTSLVSARTTDRAHRAGPTSLWCEHGGVRRRFVGAEVTFHGRLGTSPRRAPGAMAALHSDAAHPALPREVRIRADDGLDRIEAWLDVRHACQLITADPVVPGSAFIHELFGSFTYRAELDGVAREGAGLGAFEHVT